MTKAMFRSLYVSEKKILMAIRCVEKEIVNIICMRKKFFTINSANDGLRRTLTTNDNDRSKRMITTFRKTLRNNHSTLTNGEDDIMRLHFKRCAAAEIVRNARNATMHLVTFGGERQTTELLATSSCCS